MRPDECNCDPPGNRKNVKFSGLCMVRVEGGKIAEAWNQYDFLSMHQQLGQGLAPLAEA
jgi:predicted ester cyclase